MNAGADVELDFVGAPLGGLPVGEYVLISQAEPQVERYRRREDGWQYCDSRDGFVDLVTGARLEMIELYANLPE